MGEDGYGVKNMSAAEGLVRIYAGSDTGIITGATLFGPGMDHIGHLFAWAIERRETADALRGREESGLEALDDVASLGA